MSNGRLFPFDLSMIGYGAPLIQVRGAQRYAKAGELRGFSGLPRSLKRQIVRPRPVLNLGTS
jgi:hypothetical protein